jgi:4-hydroxymandelate oxidase
MSEHTAIPNNILTAMDYQSHAQARLSSTIWQYLEGGAGKGLTLKANVEVFDQVGLMSRPLSNVKSGHTRLALFGQQFEHPFLLAPIAYQRLFHKSGEKMSAMAANAQAGQMVVSSLASQTVEEIIEAAQQPLWFQLYWQGDRLGTLRLLKRALSCGYNAVMFTVDAPVKQAVIALPDNIQAVNLASPLAISALQAHQSMVFDGWMAQAPTWDDVAWLRDQIKVPFLIKGLLHLADVEKTLALGCDGVVVSNHGGRVLDSVPTSLSVLPAIAKLVSGKACLLFDSGIRTGQDAYKALALGADALMIGRPYIWGLTSAGAMGVAHVLKLMRDELEMTMALSGVPTLADIKASNTIIFN